MEEINERLFMTLNQKMMKIYQGFNTKKDLEDSDGIFPHLPASI